MRAPLKGNQTRAQVFIDPNGNLTLDAMTDGKPNARPGSWTTRAPGQTPAVVGGVGENGAPPGCLQQGMEVAWGVGLVSLTLGGVRDSNTSAAGRGAASESCDPHSPLGRLRDVCWLRQRLANSANRYTGNKLPSDQGECASRSARVAWQALELTM